MTHRANLAALTLTTLLIGLLAIGTLPHPVASRVPGPLPDAPDYAYGALALLHGRYTVSWDGPARTPRYSPGFPLLLIPAVALGGVAAAVWVAWLALLGLAAATAALAWRGGGCWAAPLAVVLLVGATPLRLAGVVMSDLPSAALIVAELLLLTASGRPLAITAAGAVAGLLIWIRPANAVLVLAGCAALLALPRWRRTVPIYLAAVVPFVAALALWQWRIYGTPLQTGYQATGATFDGSHHLAALFDWRAAFQLPPNISDLRFGGAKLPNALAYPLALLGVGGYFFSLPGLGLVGLCGLLRLARQRGTTGALCRYALAVMALVLAVYLAYPFQEARFLLAPAALLALGAARQLATVARWLAARLTTAQTAAGGSARPAPVRAPAPVSARSSDS